MNNIDRIYEILNETAILLRNGPMVHGSPHLVDAINSGLPIDDLPELFAVGKILGFWSIITPSLFGMAGEEATRMAELGYIMINGFSPCLR